MSCFFEDVFCVFLCVFFFVCFLRGISCSSCTILLNNNDCGLGWGGSSVLSTELCSIKSYLVGIVSNEVFG